MKIISLGAGVQSTTLLLMALHQEFEDYPDCAIFADTGWERKDTYNHLNWLIAVCDELSFPVYVVSAGNIKEDALNATKGIGRFATMPLYITNDNGSGAMLWRQCTKEYKLEPIYHQIRNLGAKIAEVWLGISFDEVMRMKQARVKWVKNRYPLIEKRMTRRNCHTWLIEHGYYIPPKSSCIGCPFHDDNTWRNMKTLDAQSWQEAVDFDKAIRHLPKLKGNIYLHRTLKPLDVVDLNTLEDKGQLNFINECEGLCGV